MTFDASKRPALNELSGADEMLCYDVVIPSIGRPSLAPLIAVLIDHRTSCLGEIVVVDDRRGAGPELDLGPEVRVLLSGGKGPAAARNLGWRSTGSPWIVFLDDDVLPEPNWAVNLGADLSHLDQQVAGVQGRVNVPLDASTRPNDWQRNVLGLEQARWATADMAYRRSWLERIGGFDERFPRAFREDADLALRIENRGGRLKTGTRRVDHPARKVSRWASLRAQRQNADDARMRAAHGPSWRRRAGAESSTRLVLHLVTCIAEALATLLLRNRRSDLGRAGALIWFALTTEFAFQRIAPGPRDKDEILTMLVTSALIPPVAIYYRVRGEVSARAPGGPR